MVSDRQVMKLIAQMQRRVPVPKQRREKPARVQKRSPTRIFFFLLLTGTR